MDTGKHPYKIKQLAAAFKVSDQSIRNWEANGSIPPSERTVGKHRRYGSDHVVAIAKLLSVGVPTIQEDVKPAV